MKRYISMLGMCLAFAAMSTAHAEYPDRPITLVVGFSAGGGSDLIARILAQTLSQKLHQSVVVENKPGAGGVLATRKVAREKPDGYTLLLGSAAAFVINPYIQKDIGYDPQHDFAPVSSVARFSYVLLGSNKLPMSSLAQVIAYAKAHPSRLNIGSAGVGSNTHLVAADFMAREGIKLTHVPYKGTAGALGDLIAGNIQLLFDSVPTILPQIRAGKVKAFGSTGETREAELPKLPTIAQSGLKGFHASNWFAVFAPAGTSPAVVKRLNEAINASLDDPALLKRFKASGNTALKGSPQDLARLVRTETASYRKLIENAGIHID